MVNNAEKLEYNKIILIPGKHHDTKTIFAIKGCPQIVTAKL